MKRVFQFLATGLTTVALGTAAFAEVPTVPVVNLADVVGPAGPMDPNTSSLCTITWGGDLPTLYANGTAANTQSGSIFQQSGLNFDLSNCDDFAAQVKAFRSGETNYLRSTYRMMAAASEALCDDARTCPQIIYNHSRSKGDDTLVVNTNSGIQSLSDLRGKTIGLQLYGPHMGMMVEVLALAGLTVNDVNIKWYSGLTQNDTASAFYAFEAGEVDAAFLIFPDAATLTSAETGTDGAKMLFSTDSLDKAIFDVYAVRPDFAQAQPQQVADFVNALMRSTERVGGMFNRRDNNSEFDQLVNFGSQFLLGTSDNDAAGIADMTAMFAEGVAMQRWTGNVNFLTCNGGSPSPDQVCLTTLQAETGQAFKLLGLLRDPASVNQVVVYNHDWEGLKSGLTEDFGAQAPAFTADLKAVINAMDAGGRLEESRVDGFTIQFPLNAASIDMSQFEPQFEQALERMRRSGSLAVVIEAKAGTFHYLYTKYAQRADRSVWVAIQDDALRLTEARAENVWLAFESFARARGFDQSLASVTYQGHGLTKPVNGMCQWRHPSEGTVMDPCGPADKRDRSQWDAVNASNTVVNFTWYNVEAEGVIADDLSGFDTF